MTTGYFPKAISGCEQPHHLPVNIFLEQQIQQSSNIGHDCAQELRMDCFWEILLVVWDQPASGENGDNHWEWDWEKTGNELVETEGSGSERHSRSSLASVAATSKY